MSLGMKAFIGLVAGLILGAVLAAYAGTVAEGVAAGADLLGGLWINAILMTIVPMIVAKVIITFAQNEATVILRNAGWKAIALIAALLVIPPVLTALAMPELFAWFPIDPATASSLRESAARAGQGNASSPAAFGQWLLSIVPRNPVRAAADSAILPLIVFSLALGLALSRIGEASRETVTAFFRAIDEAIMVILNVVVRLAPAGIFALALAMSVRVGPAVFGALGYYMLVSSLTLAVFVIFPYLAVALATPISFLRFARGCSPAQLVAFATHSSLASLPAMLEGAETRLGLPRALSGIVLPLAASTYRYSAPIWFVTVVYFVGQLYGISIEPARMAAILPVAILASITVGGVPSGAVYAVLPVLMAAGLPAEAVGILLAVDPIPNAFRTTLNVTGEMAAAALLGGKSAPGR
ncbi:MAG: dicarboxylate/amino acid:cation symporter [Candidatus Latescibacterota bacterium]